MDWEDISVDSRCPSVGIGNIIMTQLQYENVTEVIPEFGEKGVRSAKVAHKLVSRTKKYLSSSAPVGEYLTDQLLIPVALAQSGSFLCTSLSLHTKTNIQIIESLLNMSFEITEKAKCYLIEVR